MPTKRRKLPHRRINERPPLWAQRLLEGVKPEPDTDDHAAFFWWFVGDHVPGLPDSDTPEGYELWSRAGANQT